MKKNGNWKNKKNAKWIQREPTDEELIQQFAASVQQQICKYQVSFRLSLADCEDLRQDIMLRLLKLKPAKKKLVWYCTTTIRNAAADSVVKLKGGKARGASQSNSQRTVSLTVDEVTHGDLLALIQRATSVDPNPTQTIVLERVRLCLSPPALLIFEWVLNERERHSVGGITDYCLSVGMSRPEVTISRLEIVHALHRHGLCRNYPPPVGNPSERRTRMTAVERLRWLDELKAKYPRLADAARAVGTAPNTLNYHCRKLHGCSYSEWAIKCS